jgi:hypothetical protein
MSQGPGYDKDKNKDEDEDENEKEDERKVLGMALARSASQKALMPCGAKKACSEIFPVHPFSNERGISLGSSDAHLETQQ